MIWEENLAALFQFGTSLIITPSQIRFYSIIAISKAFLQKNLKSLRLTAH